MAGLKGREIRLKKEIIQILTERDESIRQAFGHMNQSVGQSFNNMDFKINVLINAISELGISPDKLQEIADNMQKQAQQPQQSGGEPNANPYGESDVGPSVENSAKPEEDSGDEHGTEHFSGN